MRSAGGRFILGLGAGWHEPEYTAFGYPFDHRAGRFEEALGIIAPLLHEGAVDFHGKYYEVTDAVLRPRGPSPKGPPLLIGAKGERMLRLTATYADAYNTVWHTDTSRVVEMWGKVREACDAVGRDPATLELTAGVFIGFPDLGYTPADGNAITGTDEEIAAQLRAFTDVGVTHLIVIFKPSTTLAAIERFGRVAEILDRG